MESPAENIKIFGGHDEATIKQIETCVAAGGERGVLLADGHKGYAQPIGGVVAYKDKISLSGVGFDIACGNLAVLTDAKREQVEPKINKIMDDVVRDISFGVGRKSKTRVEHELFDDPVWELQPMRGLKSTAEDQLGTVGGGNHYVDLFADEEGRIWVGVHFGSRGLGHKTATHFLKKAGGKEGMDVQVDTPMLGAKQWRDMWCAEFWAQTLSKRCITITTSPGGKNMMARNIGWCARARRQRFRGRRASSAAVWATTP